MSSELFQAMPIIHKRVVFQYVSWHAISWFMNSLVTRCTSDDVQNFIKHVFFVSAIVGCASIAQSIWSRRAARFHGLAKFFISICKLPFSAYPLSMGISCHSVVDNCRQEVRRWKFAWVWTLNLLLRAGLISQPAACACFFARCTLFSFLSRPYRI